MLLTWFFLLLFSKSEIAKVIWIHKKIELLLLMCQLLSEKLAPAVASGMVARRESSRSKLDGSGVGEFLI